MAFILGLNAKTYINQDYADLVETWFNTSTPASSAALAAAVAAPNWQLRDNITDVQINNSLATTDVTTRGGNGYRQVLGTLKEGEISFDVIYDTADPLFTALFQAYETNALVDMAFADGLIATPGTLFYRAQFSITDFSIDQSLEEAMRVSVTLQTGFSTGVPGFFTVP